MAEATFKQRKYLADLYDRNHVRFGQRKTIHHMNMQTASALIDAEKKRLEQVKEPEDEESLI